MALRLLAVLAHPDDETFGMGGTLAMYSRRNVETYLVCATRGEVGEMDERYLRGFNSIGERRESELRCAAQLLGIKQVYILNYRDSGMPGSPDNQHPMALVAQPLDQVAADVAHYIRLIRPQVVLTFDPIGGYRHPDHIAIHNATVRAFASAGDIAACPDPEGLPAYTPQKLYFHTMPRAYMRAGVFVLRLLGKNPHKFGRNGDIDLASIAGVNYPTHARINFKSVARIRDEAATCHASQGGSQMVKGPTAWLRHFFASRETFMQAIPPPQSQRVHTDFFYNVKA
jgi:N-acetyl-1-D-myo-inositol-2-amino-2-deoxy-alpha-D-glucopyranoside deacetylase